MTYGGQSAQKESFERIANYAGILRPNTTCDRQRTGVETVKTVC